MNESPAIIETELEANDAQLMLTLGKLGFKAVRPDRTGPPKRYTGELLKRENPEQYETIIALGAEPGTTLESIGRVVHCHHLTVKAVLAANPEKVDAYKKRNRVQMRLVQRATLERLSELAPVMSAKDAALTFGITTDKINLDDGNATARIEITDGSAVIRKFTELHERIEKIVHGEVIDPPSLPAPAENDFDRENSAPNATPASQASDPITSDNRDHIKSNVVDTEELTHDATDSYNFQNETDVPAGAGEGGGGDRSSTVAAMPHPLTQLEIL